MSSGITFSGFNSIDFNTILNAMMTQESAPLTRLQSKQTSLKSQVNNLNTLSTRITTLQNAVTALSKSTDASSFKATSADATIVTASASSSSVAGRYEINVTELARAQVTASANAAPDANTTTVATGGSITIGTTTIAISSATTLKQLSDAINASSDAPARASVVQSGTNAYKLVLTAKNTGSDSAFTITNSLTGGTFGLQFTDTDADGVSGDSAADNAVQAANAQLTVNNVSVTSASNTITSAIPGTTLTLLKKNAGAVNVDVASDPAALKTKLQSVVTAYNDVVKFMNDQSASAAKGDAASLGHDAILRGLKSTLRTALSAKYETGGAFNYLSRIGVEMTTSGTMQLNNATFNDAIQNGTSDVSLLLAGTDAKPGAFAKLADALTAYTQTSGVVQSAQNQINSQISRLGQQVDTMTARLALRRSALQAEFTAADAAMTRLKSQSGTLANTSTSVTQ